MAVVHYTLNRLSPTNYAGHRNFSFWPFLAIDWSSNGGQNGTLTLFHNKWTKNNVMPDFVYKVRNIWSVYLSYGLLNYYVVPFEKYVLFASYIYMWFWWQAVVWESPCDMFLPIILSKTLPGYWTRPAVGCHYRMLHQSRHVTNTHARAHVRTHAHAHTLSVRCLITCRCTGRSGTSPPLG